MFDTNNNIQRWSIIQKVLTLSIIFLLKAYNYLKKNDYLAVNGKIDIMSKKLFYEIYIYR